MMKSDSDCRSAARRGAFTGRRGRVRGGGGAAAAARLASLFGHAARVGCRVVRRATAVTRRCAGGRADGTLADGVKLGLLWYGPECTGAAPRTGRAPPPGAVAAALLLSFVAAAAAAAMAGSF